MRIQVNDSETIIQVQLTLEQIGIWTVQMHFYMDFFNKYVVMQQQNLHDNAGDARDVDSVPGWSRYPGVGKDNPLQFYCLKNSVNSGAWWAIVYGVTKSWMWLSAHVCTTILYIQSVCIKNHGYGGSTT